MSNDQKSGSSQGSAARDAPPLILAIETATRAGSVSVARGEKILASTFGDPSSSHSTDLIENIESVLRDAGAELREVDLFAVAIGPGSFTGLRIGIATVKSFAVALNGKCAAVSTLAAVAFAAGKSERTIALLPAGRGEVFAQMFSVNESVQALDEAAHISPATLLAKYGVHQRVLWAGEGAQVQIETLRKGAGERGIAFLEGALHRSTGGWSVAPPQQKLAEAVAMIALEHWRAGELVSPEELRANYVRPSDAEMKTHA